MLIVMIEDDTTDFSDEFLGLFVTLIVMVEDDRINFSDDFWGSFLHIDSDG